VNCWRRGRGPQVEYKQRLPETSEQKRKVLKTVAAFVTGDEGILVFGMDPDELTVAGPRWRAQEAPLSAP
jgi:hypothetical protein